MATGPTAYHLTRLTYETGVDLTQGFRKLFVPIEDSDMHWQKEKWVNERVEGSTRMKMVEEIQR